ncbi:enoyl-CoA hydratase/isomerase family protein [Paraburkholderia caballeronis]|uniref:Enoyl-CoA hydratase/isomerase n=1 Tax=Paraburkholderia caballeronis TaxID=416943 RepID=A0A1H7JTD3_9BURK|nr:enoyl-CoA hydratase/isomerase family protein [Paraburkholderia caballeronis]PXW27276.1 enoyl-CoA hydratase/isomerase-like protein [Paraburkholderia caballeronis]PXX02750.1 enoyl-CoA hydratase/isomerase-like protein [Paraburkholderia caballeronis]RAK03475.1 enoyl-CoA hydratase/isomerase-like protein [Paraburkholderia caballeronis]TDV17138.1 enoyl-CoA hydratase/isomerase-like protein [Paraburkholderia caballeronis]TDV17523.1 enoyl-CoA hydratase/isomerase-like protein [Paraburkholderia caballe
MSQPAYAEASDPHVATRVSNGIGFIELDRPQALNALTTGMVRAMHAALDTWRENPEVLAVIVLSRHPRAFCAGGDVRFLYDAHRDGDQHAIDTFFIDEYRLDHAIFTYPKPYIAFLNGIVMGGGMGISQGAHRTAGLRVVGGTTRMAMPETRIGLFPDVGMGWFLARTRGAVGRYLAVTGETIEAADALYVSLADVWLDEAAWPALIDALQSEPFETGADIVARIRREAEANSGGAPAPDASALANARAWIDRHFAQPDVPRILASLEAAQHEADGAAADWAARTIGVLRERSPLSMAVSLDVVARADGSMAECLRRDLDLTRSSFAQGDVIEGIRARLVDKDNRPQWRIERIEDVRAEDVERMFESPWSAAQHPLRDLVG